MRIASSLHAIAVRTGLALPDTASMIDPDRRVLERRRRARWSILVNILSRGLAFLTVLVSARIALPDLGPDRFGIWMTISSLLLMVTFLDFGVGNALVAPIAEALAEDRPDEARRIASRGMVLTALIGLAMGVVVVTICSVVPLEGLFPGVSLATLTEARTGLIVFGALIGLTPTLGGIGRILAGMQRAYISHLANTVGSIATIVLMVVLGGRGLSIAGYVLMTFGIVQIAALATGILLWREGWLSAIYVRGASWSVYREMLATGGLFLGIQATMVIAIGLDQTIISAMLGPAAVAGYAIAQRLFMLVSQPLYILNAPLWAAYADALHRGDRDDVRRTLRRSISGTIGIACLGGALLILAGPYAWQAVTGRVVPYSAALMFGFALWSVVESVSNAWGMYLNAANLLREQLVTMTVVALLCVSAKLVVLSSGWVSGVVIVGALAYVFVQLFFYAGPFRRRVMKPLNST
jgi:O-antigen/teichoic acid export membrane protein